MSADLVNEDQYHRRLDRHAMDLDQGENSEGGGHLPAATFEEVST